jgi:hypothetical protein
MDHFAGLDVSVKETSTVAIAPFRSPSPWQTIAGLWGFHLHIVSPARACPLSGKADSGADIAE